MLHACGILDLTHMVHFWVHRRIASTGSIWISAKNAICVLEHVSEKRLVGSFKKESIPESPCPYIVQRRHSSRGVDGKVHQRVCPRAPIPEVTDKSPDNDFVVFRKSRPSRFGTTVHKPPKNMFIRIESIGTRSFMRTNRYSQGNAIQSPPQQPLGKCLSHRTVMPERAAYQYYIPFGLLGDLFCH